MLRITADVRDEMFAHAIRNAPNEACGMFSSPAYAALIDEFHPMANAAASPTAYLLDGQELLDLEASIDAAGRELRGVMHSHPTTSAYPSPTDLRDSAAFDPAGVFHHLIVSLRGADPIMRCYQMTGGEIVEVQVICSDDMPSADDGSPAVAMAAVQRLPQP